MKKNLITVITSTVISFLLIYFLSFLIVYFKNHEEFSSFLFKEMESLNFHKKYSKKMHHIRTIDFETPNNLENFLFSTINDFSSHNKNILLQGDSWMEAINLQYKNSKKKITKFAKENNYGLINAGITSFSPSLMMVQYATLENDFNIKPSIVVAYIDQTDIGDEICRYKDLRVLDKKNNLIAVKNEFYTRRIYDYAQYYRWSEILLSENINIVKKLQFTNFFIKFKTLRVINKIKNIKKFGWENREGNRCPFNKITKYLKNIEKKDLIHFENILKEYVNFLANKDYIDKIIFVTFPHRNHMILESDKDYYSVNVSDIVSKAILNKQKIEHINFTKLMLEKKIKYNPDIYLVNDPASHLKEEYQSKLLLEKIIQEIKK